MKIIGDYSIKDYGDYFWRSYSRNNERADIIITNLQNFLKKLYILEMLSRMSRDF